MIESLPVRNSRESLESGPAALKVVLALAFAAGIPIFLAMFRRRSPEFFREIAQKDLPRILVADEPGMPA